MNASILDENRGLIHQIQIHRGQRIFVSGLKIPLPHITCDTIRRAIVCQYGLTRGRIGGVKMGACHSGVSVK